MFSGRGTQMVLRILDRLIPEPAQPASPIHQLVGRRGEEDVYFYLRRLGYVMVARNYRSARHHGEIDLIGWDKDVLCFIEVKTRTTHDVASAEAAVHRDKRRAVRQVAHDFLNSLPRKLYPQPPPWRFDVVTVYYEKHQKDPTFEVFQNASLSSKMI
jgi:putative endonuclease